MPLPKLDLRHRWIPILCVLIAAPICAEFLQMYLPNSGEIVFILIAMVIFAPLYGGAALLIREVAVRRGLGWTGIVLLAVAFGILMPGIVDLALFAEHRPDIAYWEEMREATLITPLGISASTTITWIAGHVFMSVGAPLALLATLAPQHRGRPLLGRWGIVTIVVLFLLAAAFIRQDAVATYEYQPTVVQTAAVAAVVIALVALALSRVGRPVPAIGSGVSRGWLLVLSGAVGMFLIDATPYSWGGTLFMVGILLAMAVASRRLAVAKSWSPYDIGAVAAGALVGRTLIGFLSPPVEGMSIALKLVQSSALLAGVLIIAWLVLHQRAAAHSSNVDSDQIAADTKS